KNSRITRTGSHHGGAPSLARQVSSAAVPASGEAPAFFSSAAGAEDFTALATGYTAERASRTTIQGAAFFTGCQAPGLARMLPDAEANLEDGTWARRYSYRSASMGSNPAARDAG